MKELGEVSSYYGNLGVAAVKLRGKLKTGDKIRIQGQTTDFEQIIDSMQINHKKVSEAKKGDEIGIKVNERVRRNDKIFMSG